MLLLTKQIASHPVLIKILQALSMFILGLVSWACWVLRTVSCVEKQPLSVFFLVLIEEIVGILALYLIVKNKTILGTIVYAVGGALGAALMTWLG